MRGCCWSIACRRVSRSTIPRSSTAARSTRFAWLKQDLEPAHTEYRDDRFVAAIDREAGPVRLLLLAYVVRAVAPGNYVYPPATVEDMYRPERFGRTAFGELEVTAK